MFLSRKDWTIAITVAYLFLIFLFVVVKDDQGIKQCDLYDPCVSFCCQNSSSCSEDSIRKSFNASAHPLIFDSEPFAILRGRPKCSLEAVAKDHVWKFEYVNDFEMNIWKNIFIFELYRIVPLKFRTNYTERCPTTSTVTASKKSLKTARSLGICLCVAKASTFTELLCLSVSC